MLSDSEQKRSMENCGKVRNYCRVRFLQVMPDPDFADNVQVRVGHKPWRTLHVHDAIAFVRNAFRKERQDRMKSASADPAVSKKEQQRRLRLRAALNAMFNIDDIKKRRDALLAKGITP
jgi:hypothetical protein